MSNVLSRLRRYICHDLKEIRTYYAECAKELTESNWSTLRRMILLYFAYLLVYLLAVCAYLAIPIQTAALRVSVLVHGVFCVAVYLRGRKAPSPQAVNMLISFFAFEILGIAGFIGIAVFPDDAAFLFPLILILITQLYNRTVIYTVIEMSVSIATYLALSFCLKTPDVFALDVIAVTVALGIALVAQHSMTGFRLRAYDSQRSLRRMCETDQMTGVNNKTTFQYRVEQCLRARGRTTDIALAVCDLDGFKGVNDQYGHRMGDRVLKAFAEKLHTVAVSDPNAIVGRFGGDEFVIFFKDGGDQAAIVESLKPLCRIEGFDFPTTCSVGVAFAQSGALSFDELFDWADKNAYRAKRQANGSVFHSSAPGE